MVWSDNILFPIIQTTVPLIHSSDESGKKKRKKKKKAKQSHLAKLRGNDPAGQKGLQFERIGEAYYTTSIPMKLSPSI